MIKPVEKIRSFYTETVTELKKCTWPTWQELRESTALIIVTSLLLGAFIFVVDIAIRTIVRFFT